MIDEVSWNTIATLLSIIDHSRRPDDVKASTLGNIHVILFGEHILLKSYQHTNKLCL